MASVDYGRMAEAYESGRSLPAPALESWGTAIAPFVPQSPSSRILDLGAGTGMWADAFANWSPAQVIGIDPAEGMRREARRAHGHARVHYLGGRAAPGKKPRCEQSFRCRRSNAEYYADRVLGTALRRSGCRRSADRWSGGA